MAKKMIMEVDALRDNGLLILQKQQNYEVSFFFAEANKIPNILHEIGQFWCTHIQGSAR
jgi:hypothetical protein